MFMRSLSVYSWAIVRRLLTFYWQPKFCLVLANCRHQGLIWMAIRCKIACWECIVTLFFLDKSIVYLQLCIDVWSIAQTKQLSVGQCNTFLWLEPVEISLTPFPPKKLSAGSKLVRSWFNFQTFSEPVCFSTD